MPIKYQIGGFSNKLIMKKVFFLFFIPTIVQGQFLYDTLYYQKFYNKTLWSLYINSVSNSFGLSQKFQQDTLIKTNLNITAESFQEYGISYSNHKQFIMINLFTAPGTDAKRKPTPRYSNGMYSYSDRNYLIDLGYNWFTNYYEKNTSNFYKNFNDSTPFYDYGKLRSLNTFINYTHFTNYKKFSYRAAYTGTARQKKSAASFLYFFNTNYNRLESDSAIIPFQIRKNYNQFGELNRLYNIRLAAGAGGSGTLVLFKSFFINGTLLVGPGLQFQQYSFKATSGFKNRVNTMYLADLRFAIGINLNRFVLSNVTLINYQAYSISKLSYTNTILSNRFSIGYRFNTRSRKIFGR